MPGRISNRKLWLGLLATISALFAGCGGGADRVAAAASAQQSEQISPMPDLVVFFSGRDASGGNSSAMYTMHADGSGVARIANSTESDTEAHSSADGRRIVFSSARGFYGTDTHLFVINRDGSGFAQLTDGGGFQDGAHFSPDGSLIVFSQNWRIRVMNADGSGLRDLTSPDSGDRGPIFTPDGRKIAFWRSSAPAPVVLHLVDLDGSNDVAIALPNASQFRAPAFSVDGSRIVYEAWPGPRPQIFAANRDGSGVVNLTSSSFSEMAPQVLAGKILFASNRAGNMEIFSMNLDGTGAVNLTRHSAQDAFDSYDVFSPPK